MVYKKSFGFAYHALICGICGDSFASVALNPIRLGYVFLRVMSRAYAPGGLCAVVAEAFPEKPEALMVALVPASKPATAAPVSRYLFDFVIFPNVLLNDLTARHF